MLAAQQLHIGVKARDNGTFLTCIFLRERSGSVVECLIETEGP